MADKITTNDLNQGDFFFIVGDSKTPYRKIEGGYMNMSNGRVDKFNEELPENVRKTFDWQLKAKYGMDQFQFEAWLEHITKLNKKQGV